jgi:hypothetical protein
MECIRNENPFLFTICWDTACQTVNTRYLDAAIEMFIMIKPNALVNLILKESRCSRTRCESQQVSMKIENLLQSTWSLSYLLIHKRTVHLICILISCFCKQHATQEDHVATCYLGSTGVCQSHGCQTANLL